MKNVVPMFGSQLLAAMALGSLLLGCAAEMDATSHADESAEAATDEAEQALSCDYTWTESEVYTTYGAPLYSSCAGYRYSGYYVECSTSWKESFTTIVEYTYHTTDCSATREIIDARTVQYATSNGWTFSFGSCGSALYDPVFQQTSGCYPP